MLVMPQSADKMYLQHSRLIWFSFFSATLTCLEYVVSPPIMIAVQFKKRCKTKSMSFISLKIISRAFWNSSKPQAAQVTTKKGNYETVVYKPSLVLQDSPASVKLSIHDMLMWKRLSKIILHNKFWKPNSLLIRKYISHLSKNHWSDTLRKTFKDLMRQKCNFLDGMHPVT